MGCPGGQCGRTGAVFASAVLLASTYSILHADVARAEAARDAQRSAMGTLRWGLRPRGSVGVTP